jgi:hypothetical protein
MTQEQAYSIVSKYIKYGDTLSEREISLMLIGNPPDLFIHKETSQQGNDYFYIPVSISEVVCSILFPNHYFEIQGSNTIGVDDSLVTYVNLYLYPNKSDYSIVKYVGTASKYTDKRNIENIELDYPLCYTMAKMNCYKQMGNYLGRSLNRLDLESEKRSNELFLSITKEDTEFENMKKAILEIDNYKLAKEILEASAYKYEARLNKLVNDKQKQEGGGQKTEKEAIKVKGKIPNVHRSVKQV